MWALKNWRLGRGSKTEELLVYSPGQEPPPEDIDHFVRATEARLPLLPFQTSRYVLRETRQTVSWLTSYISCEIEDLRANFVREEKSFYLVFQEHVRTGDRSVSFRLTTAGVEGYTEWRVTFRRVTFAADEEHFLCAEY
jgi:hypothetical protein